jgi:outer membrane immunogenic protein
MRLREIVRTGAALAALVIISATPASAADGYYGGGSLKDQPLYVPPPTWTGFYLGGHIGGAWSANDDNNHPGFFSFNNAEAPVALFSNGNNNDTSGVFGGIQFGYNWQNVGWFSPNWLLGIEIDLGGFGTDNNDRKLFATDGLGNSVSIRGGNGASGFYGDLTGRIGYTWGNTLLYGKGGFAWLNSDSNDITETIAFRGGPTEFFRNDNNSDRTLTGWTAGGGIEYMINQSWSMKVEYLYFDFTQDDRRCCFDGINSATLVPLNNIQFGNDLRFNTVKVGFNYLLHPPAPLPMK